MTLLYILLIIIAIGVLLASEPGQEFLALLIKLAVIGGLLYLGFWMIVMTIAFFTSDTGWSLLTGGYHFLIGIFEIIAGFVILWILYIGGNHLIKVMKNKEVRAKIVRRFASEVKVFFLMDWKRHKIKTTLLIVSFSSLAILIIWAVLWSVILGILGI